jgi:hypothetical protein
MALANQAHARAVTIWIDGASRNCLALFSRSASLIASTASVSVRLGVVALVLIALGIGGAIFEWRLSHRPPKP